MYKSKHISKFDLLLGTGFPQIFNNYFPYFFNTKLKKFNTMLYLHFSKIVFMKLNFIHCIH